MTADIVDLDVRPILATGSDPFAEIMASVAALAPGQRLRIVAPFRPGPLIQVLGRQGFSHKEGALGGGEWEVIFSRQGAAAVDPVAAPSDASDWPGAVRELDLRELDQPEPMVRILAATEEMAKGEVLSALLGREPLFLFPELAKRGHAWRGNLESCKTYRLFVHIGMEKQE